MKIAIHQPNYLPWPGYFHKMAQADVFILLDDAQFTKHSYINRTLIRSPQGQRWLTVPVSYTFKQPIFHVTPSQSDWARRHLDILKACYGQAPCFDEVWPWVSSMLTYAGSSMLTYVVPATLDLINKTILEGMARGLRISCQIRRASEFETNGLTGTDRLIALVHAIDPHGTYVCGQGGLAYHDEAAFRRAGIPVEVSTYPPSRSMVELLFDVGWEQAAERVRQPDVVGAG